MKYYITQQGLEFVNEVSAKYAGEVAGRVIKRAENKQSQAHNRANYKERLNPQHPAGAGPRPSTGDEKKAMAHTSRKKAQSGRILHKLKARAEFPTAVTDKKDRGKSRLGVVADYGKGRSSSTDIYNQ